MPQFRSRKIIEAVQWNGRAFSGEHPAWLEEALTKNVIKRSATDDGTLFICSAHGDIEIPTGSWLFKTAMPPGVDAYQADAFASAYEMVGP